MASSEESSGRKAEKFMKKAERLKCYSARDAYWKCLDGFEEYAKSGNIKKEIPQECQPLKDLYATECPPTWVTHFDRKYHFEKFKVKMKEEGFKETQDKEFLDKKSS